MRETLLQYLVCPACQTAFHLEVAQQDEDHIMEGMLHCRGCKAAYRITEGIPRLLNQSHVDPKNKETAERFGQQWDAFDFIDVERYQMQFLDWIAPISREFFQHKLILDAGCGKGRHCIAASRFQAQEVIGIDLAEGSVRAAFRNTRNIPNIHIIQTDIYALPFRENLFDYIYSIGVLHHTPEPKQAFTCLVKKLKPGGTVSAWVYSKEGNGWVITLVNPLRKYVTSKFPLPIVKSIAFILTIGLQCALKCVYAPLNAYQIFHPCSRYLPYNEYLYYISKFPFHELYCIVFDHLLPEIALYIEKEEFSSWFDECHLHDICITSRTNNSWRGKGEKS
ncbi:methyltransferase type 11 [Candidatus Vecturithrix granuli]|uniref:Methyltransferase type 11 n=1 Tax=Vecturithrix granuli TaxID=1499967 RepID=A0A0S6W9Z4_VECG1|nr:methyltransferase type 11 [Candidatus Vecturithrix granuli]